MIPVDLDNIRIRYLLDRDHEAYVALEKDAEVKRFVGGPSEKSNRLLLQNLRDYSPSLALLAMAELETDAFIGRCGLLDCKAPLEFEVEIYCLLARSHWRKGIAKAVVPFLFQLASSQGKTGVAYVHPENVASHALMRRVGLVAQGTKSATGWQHGHIRYVIGSD